MSYVTSIERFAKKEGRVEGLSQGLSKGLVLGEANLLERQLTRKFGLLSKDIQKRLKDATPAQ